MTARGRYKHSSFLAGLLLVSACASPLDRAVAANTPPGAVQGEVGASLDVLAELSSSEVANGSIALVQVTIPPGGPYTSVVGNYEGIILPFYETTLKGVYEAVLSVPYEHKIGDSAVDIRVEGNCETTTACATSAKTIKLPLKVVDGNYPSETLHVAGKHVNPSPRMMPRIQREQHEAAAIYDRLTKVKYWNGPFQMPVKSAITSAFGSKRIYNGELKNFHPGVDLKAPMRTRIRAAAPGVIVMAKNLYYTGNTVMIDHGYGVITLYAHMSKLKVKKGQLVRSGQLLGLSGMTGRVTGPHLHWQAVIHHVKINPLDLTKVMR